MLQETERFSEHGHGIVALQNILWNITAKKKLSFSNN